MSLKFIRWLFAGKGCIKLMSRKMTDAIERIIEKVKFAADKADENDKYTISGDKNSQEWLQDLKIVNRIRLFPDFYGVWVVHKGIYYLGLVNHEMFTIPKFLEEEQLNSGAWIAILYELDLPLKKDIDISQLQEVLDTEWEQNNQEYKEIIFDQNNNRYSLKDFFPDVSLYKITLKFTQPDELHQILGLMLVKGTNCRLLPYSEEVIKKFEEIFDDGDKNIPFDNLLASYVASDFKFAYLDVYRCIEKLQPLYFFKEFYKTLSFKDGKSLLKFCDDFYATTKLEPSLSNSLQKLLESVKRVPIKSIPIIIWQLLIHLIEDDFMAGFIFIYCYKYPIKSNAKNFDLYNIRNQIVHLRPNQTNHLIPKGIIEWNELILNILNIVKELYSQNTDLFTDQEERIALTEKFNQLCEDTQNLFIENQITEEEIQAEIDAYRRGE